MSSLCSVGHWSGHQALEGSNVTKDLKLHAILCLTLPNQEPQSGCTQPPAKCAQSSCSGHFMLTLQEELC